MDFIEVLTALFADIDTLFRTGAGIAIGIVIFVLICKGGFSFAKVLGGLVVGGLVTWMVGFGGIETMGQLFDGTFSNYESGATSVTG